MQCGMYNVYIYWTYVKDSMTCVSNLFDHHFFASAVNNRRQSIMLSDLLSVCQSVVLPLTPILHDTISLYLVERFQ